VAGGRSSSLRNQDEANITQGEKNHMSIGNPSESSTHELVLTRHIKAPRHNLFRCWTEPGLQKQWFAPRPYVVTVAETDLRAGGASLIVMRGPDGLEIPCPGVYLEVVKDERLVFTDAYTKAWEPSAKPFMTAIITFADEDGGTRYTARALHWTAEDKAAHEKMGFHQGWGLCADQLAALAATL
jgi:uncharacterized protein YndB with AHSA1/START domain